MKLYKLYFLTNKLLHSTNMSKSNCKKNNILEQFTRYAKMLREQKQNRFKIVAAQSIVKGLHLYPDEICDEEDIQKFLRYIGKKTAKKTVTRMVSILEKGHLEEVTAYYVSRDHATFDILEALTTVYGIGPAKAKYLYETCSISSVQELVDRVLSQHDVDELKLTSAQLLGSKHHSDLITRIPRKEIQSYEKKIRKALLKLDADMSICIAGSYRRGEKTSGDIDLLLCSPNEIVMEDVVQSLSKMIEGTLAKGNKKSMLLSRLTKRSRVRHMDIIITTPSQFPYAQLYFTGSKEFNIRMRKHALQKGYSLNEYDLTVVHAHSQSPPEMSSENDIFDFLKFKYVKPTERSMA